MPWLTWAHDEVLGSMAERGAALRHRLSGAARGAQPGGKGIGRGVYMGGGIWFLVE